MTTSTKNKATLLNRPIDIIAKDLTKVVESGSGKLTILNQINLEIKSGQTLAVIGASGSGKTTLLSLLAGLDKPSSGQIYYNNLALGTQNEATLAAIRGQYTGFIFQSFHLLPHFTALENVMLPLELKGNKAAKKFAEAWLEKVGLQDRMNHYPHMLSGGEQQRVAIARAFIAKPQILFADEPTGNLDNKSAERIMELLFELNKTEKSTLVVVTHNDELAAHCQVQLALSGGQIV